MISEKGFDLIREFEGCRLEAYLDELAKPPVWTIGWGQTGPDVVQGLVWTQDMADNRLYATVSQFAIAVRGACSVRPNANQFAAMTSFAYNVGVANFRKSSVLRLHNEGKHPEAAAAFAMWNKAGGRVRAGLTRRRAAEAALYLAPIAGSAPQTTRAEPEAKDPQARPPAAAIAATAGAALTGAQQAVAQVSSIWDSLDGIGISPHVLLAVLGVAAVGTLGWFLWAEWKRRSEGSR